MSKTVTRIWNWITTVLVIIVVVLALLLVGARLVGLQVLTVLSGSMEPTYHVGSLIYVKDVDPYELESGDVITFMLDEDTVATHRIVEVVPDENDSTVVRFRTKGDANDAEDGSLVHYKNVVGSPVFTIAKFKEQIATINYAVEGPGGCGTVDLNDGNVTGALTTTSETVPEKTGNAVGATAAASSNVYKFVGWYDTEGNPLSTKASFVPNKVNDLNVTTTYYAKFEYNLTTMKVTKTVNGDPYDADDTFIFRVKDSKNTVIANFTLKNGGSVTIADVTVGETYTVEEIWTSNRYRAAQSSIVVTVQANTDETQKNVAAFTNNIGVTKWLTATSVENNVFGDN